MFVRRAAVVVALFVLLPLASPATADDGSPPLTGDTCSAVQIHPWNPNGTDGSMGTPSGSSANDTSRNQPQGNSTPTNPGPLTIRNGFSICSVLTIDPSRSWPPPPPVEIPPLWLEISNVSVAHLSHDRATIIWTTNAPTIGRVLWGPINAAPNAVADDALVFTKWHALELSGLQPGERYRFYIVAFDEQARGVQTGEVEFAAPPLPQDPLVDGMFVAFCAIGTVAACIILWRGRR
jgi:hypothetical protein